MERPGLGLALVGAGILVALLSFLAVPWVDGGGRTGFLDIRDALARAGDSSSVSVAGRIYVSWVAFATLVVVALFAVPAATGLRSGATTVFRTLGAVAALGGIGVHALGVWQLFYDTPDAASSGPWLLYLAYGLMVFGAALGPRKIAPAYPAPAFVPPHGYPPHGYPNGYPPHGYPPAGYPAAGAAPPGYPSSEYPPPAQAGQVNWPLPRDTPEG